MDYSLVLPPPPPPPPNSEGSKLKLKLDWKGEIHTAHVESDVDFKPSYTPRKKVHKSLPTYSVHHGKYEISRGRYSLAVRALVNTNLMIHASEFRIM